MWSEGIEVQYAKAISNLNETSSAAFESRFLCFESHFYKAPRLLEYLMCLMLAVSSPHLSPVRIEFDGDAIAERGLRKVYDLRRVWSGFKLLFIYCKKLLQKSVRFLNFDFGSPLIAFQAVVSFAFRKFNKVSQLKSFRAKRFEFKSFRKV